MFKSRVIPFFGDVPSLEGIEYSFDSYTTTLVANVPVNSFSVRIVDNGLDSFGLPEGAIAILQPPQVPSCEGTICLVKQEGTVSFKLVEKVNDYVSSSIR